MKDEISNLKEKLKKAAANEKGRLFVMLCLKLIEYKDTGKMREEEAAYEMVGAGMSSDINDLPECEAIFACAANTEIERELSYAQSMDHWDEKTANRIKEDEWAELVEAVRKAKNSL